MYPKISSERLTDDTKCGVCDTHMSVLSSVKILEIQTPESPPPLPKDIGRMQKRNGIMMMKSEHLINHNTFKNTSIQKVVHNSN